MNIEERRKRNELHASDPRPGDYWHECFCGVCVVIGRMGGHVIFCRKKTHFPEENKWTWDLEKLEMKSVEDFKKWLAYNSIPGYWASVEPGCHMWAVEHANNPDAEAA